MIHRGYKYKLDPTAEQAARFAQFAGVCRLIYNLDHGLANSVRMA